MSTMDIQALLDSMQQNEQLILEWMAYFMIINAGVTFVSLQFMTAPYGRYSSSSWGCLVNGKLAWIVQELPSLLIPCTLLLLAPRLPTSNLVLLTLFLIHYTQRALIFPLLIQGGKPTPFIPFALAFVFCLYNGFMQGRHLTAYAKYDSTWISQPQFIIGCVMFFSGMAINIHSDHVLRNLRKPGETGYKIPKGGMFEYVSGANFFGETLEWGGFAVACWSLPALAFFIFTASNIGPRAVSHHKWYLQKFEDYPSNRRAFIPFLI